MSDQRIVLRNFPGNPVFDDKRFPKSLAFSPDIIPQYGNNRLVDDLINDLAYGSFLGFPLVPHDDNLIFVRGITSPDTTTYFTAAISLRAIPSELILWPQIWNQEKPLAPGPLFIKTGKVHYFERLATDAAFRFRPSYLGGLGYSLIAHHPVVSAEKLDATNQTRGRDLIPPPPPNINNCKEYYEFVTSDTTTTYYSVLVVDPTPPFISVTTRLRIFDDDPNNINTLWLSVWHAGVPLATEISLSSDDRQIYSPRRGIANTTAGICEVKAKAGFDGFITMNIFRPDNVQFDAYSWMSLRCLGALNILFEADSTRNIRFASPAAGNMRNNNPHPQNPQQVPVPTTAPQLPLLPTYPVATGWWFRTTVTDINWFPRTVPSGIYSESPDIVFVGHQKIDVSILLDPTHDYLGVNLTSDTNNFVYVRGHCTLPNIIIEARLYTFPASAILHPTLYATQFAVKDEDGSIAVRTLTTKPGTDFYVFDEPFNLHSLPNPLDYGANHYCMIAEVRQKVNKYEDPHWPHEFHVEFESQVDFVPWLTTQPGVSWKNIAWIPSTVHITIVVKIVFPVIYTYSTIWIIVIRVYNAPRGSHWKLAQVDGTKIPGLTIGFDERSIPEAESVWGCHFTGVPGGYDGTLQFEWISDDGQPAPINMYFSYQLGTCPTNGSPGLVSYDPVPGNEQWPFYVGNQYPNLAASENPSLVPRFEKDGPNVFPYSNIRWVPVGANIWNIFS